MILQTYQDRLLKVIPAGAHTYSRGFDQYPSNAPQILKNGLGAYVYDDKDNKYLDYGMALRAVNLGYANDKINQAAIKEINNGNNLTRASMIELEAAELLVDLIPFVDMVKFTKNGSTATTAAIKLSRAYTNKTMVVRCAEHPFFSYDDWFIGSTPVTKGIKQDDIDNTKLFHYNDIKSLENLFEKYSDQIACVILEPATTEHPKDNFLHKVKELCLKYNAVFILDEMITGFRWSLGGACEYYKIEPDLVTYGKAMANGFSVACIAGKKEIMSLGSIEKKGSERLFLLSTTHGAEMCGLGAFVESIKFLRENKVIDHLWDYGNKLIDIMNNKAKEYNISEYFIVDGISCSPYYLTYDKNKNLSLEFRTLFAQEMIKQGILIPWIALSYAHGKDELEFTKKALNKVFSIYRKALDEGIDKYLDGESIKPVFRKYN